MIKYTLSFAFDPNEELIVLIYKNRGPRGIKELWNGLGGKLEEGETLHQCMAREFKEECGLTTDPAWWRHFATFGDSESWQVYCFEIILKEIQNPQTMETEEVDWQSLNDILWDTTIPVSQQLKYLIPIALDRRLVAPPPYFNFDF